MGNNFSKPLHETYITLEQSKILMNFQTVNYQMLQATSIKKTLHDIAITQDLMLL